MNWCSHQFINSLVDSRTHLFAPSLVIPRSTQWFIHPFDGSFNRTFVASFLHASIRCQLISFFHYINEIVASFINPFIYYDFICLNLKPISVRSPRITLCRIHPYIPGQHRLALLHILTCATQESSKRAQYSTRYKLGQKNMPHSLQYRPEKQASFPPWSPNQGRFALIFSPMVETTAIQENETWHAWDFVKFPLCHFPECQGWSLSMFFMVDALLCSKRDRKQRPHYCYLPLV